jgi:hypothetical protein
MMAIELAAGSSRTKTAALLLNCNNYNNLERRKKLSRPFDMPQKESKKIPELIRWLVLWSISIG